MIKIMNKVIRTARISDHTVILPIQVNPKIVELSEDLDEDVVEGGDGFTPLSEQAEMVDDVVNPVEEPEPEEPEIDVEAIVAERLQEAEARFQEEKEQAVQTSYDEGHAKGVEEGHVRGMEEGHARGLEEGQAQSHDEIVRFQSMLSTLAERWSDVFKTADQNLTELAMAIAHNLVGGMVDKYEDLVLNAVRDCLTRVQDLSRIVIHVNPDDLGIVREHREEWQRAFEQIESLIVEADETIGRGGCLVETPSGDIDAQIESRLAKLQTALMEAVQNAPVEQAPVRDEPDVEGPEIENIDGVGDDGMVQTLDENVSADHTALDESETLADSEGNQTLDEAVDLQKTDEMAESVEGETIEDVVEKTDSDEAGESIENEMLDEGDDVADRDAVPEVAEDETLSNAVDAAELNEVAEDLEAETLDEGVDSVDLDESSEGGVEAETLDEGVDAIDLDESTGVGEDDEAGVMDSDAVDEDQNVDASSESDDLNVSDENSDAVEEPDLLEDLMVMDEDGEEESSHDDYEDDANDAESEEGK